MSTDDPLLDGLVEGQLVVDDSRFTSEPEEELPVSEAEQAMREVISPLPPHAGYVESAADVEALSDWKRYNIGPDRIMIKLITDARTVLKEMTPERKKIREELLAKGDTHTANSMNFSVNLLDATQGYGKIINVSPRTATMAQEQYGLNLEKGDLVLVRRGSGDFFTIGSDPYVAIHLPDLIAHIK